MKNIGNNRYITKFFKWKPVQVKEAAKTTEYFNYTKNIQLIVSDFVILLNVFLIKMNVEQCSVCLEKYTFTISVEDSDEYNVKWFTKLQFIVPELEWLEEYIICESCKKQLEQAWKFKKLVLNLEVERRSWLAKKESYLTEESFEFKDNYFDIEYYYREDRGVACEICSKVYTTQTQLQQHKLQNHVEDCSNDETPLSQDGLQTLGKNENTIAIKKVSVVFSCYECGAGFGTKENLLLHIENVHQMDENQIEVSKELACFLCLQKFESETKLSEHSTLCASKFHCYTCQQVYNTKKLLIDHLPSCKKQTGGNKIHQCICKNFYTTERKLNLHKVWCSKGKEEITLEGIKYSCDICVLKFNSVEDYDSHNVSKHNSPNSLKTVEPSKSKTKQSRKPLKSFSCENCSEQFYFVKSAVAHCVSVHGTKEKNVKPYSCDKCEMRFASFSNLHQHRSYHEKNRVHICSLCGKGFITKSDLTVHEYTHYNRRNYKCSQCDKAFNTNKNLRTHHLVVHTDRSLWKFGCNICEKRFPLKTNFEQHMRRHTGEKKYICHICIKPFISKSEMERHIKLHSNYSAFKCTECDKEYKARRTYQSHLAKVHGIGVDKVYVREKKFVCHICPSQFYDKQKLSRHLYGHSGLKPFACHSCEKKFTDKSYLKHHLKVTHNILEPLKPEGVDGISCL